MSTDLASLTNYGFVSAIFKITQTLNGAHAAKACLATTLVQPTVSVDSLLVFVVNLILVFVGGGYATALCPSLFPLRWKTKYRAQARGGFQLFFYLHCWRIHTNSFVCHSLRTLRLPFETQLRKAREVSDGWSGNRNPLVIHHSLFELIVCKRGLQGLWLLRCER